MSRILFFFFFQAEDGIRDYKVTGVQTCALPISRAGAAAARGVPPVEHVALDELMRSVEDDLGTREVGPGVDQRGGVLELVAKAERAARLIERRPPPQAAGER